MKERRKSIKKRRERRRKRLGFILFCLVCLLNGISTPNGLFNAKIWFIC